MKWRSLKYFFLTFQTASSLNSAIDKKQTATCGLETTDGIKPWFGWINECDADLAPEPLKLTSFHGQIDQ